MWQLGQYIHSAVASVLSGKKNVKYIEKPFFTQERERREIENMTEEEKIIQTNEFFKKLMVMQSKFEKSKGV